MRDEKKFCSICGSELIRVITRREFDPYHGGSISHYDLNCPGAKWWAPWTWRHDLRV